MQKGPIFKGFSSAERSAARLAHQSGGLGVPSSNLGAPTIKIPLKSELSAGLVQACEPVCRGNESPEVAHRVPRPPKEKSTHALLVRWGKVRAASIHHGRHPNSAFGRTMAGHHLIRARLLRLGVMPHHRPSARLIEIKERSRRSRLLSAFVSVEGIDGRQ